MIFREINYFWGGLFVPCGPAGCETTPHLSLGVDDPVEQMLHLVRQAGRVLPVLSAPQRLLLSHPGGGAVQQTHRLSGRQERGERSQAFVIWSVRTLNHLIVFFLSYSLSHSLSTWYIPPEDTGRIPLDKSNLGTEMTRLLPGWYSRIFLLGIYVSLKIPRWITLF